MQRIICTCLVLYCFSMMNVYAKSSISYASSILNIYNEWDSPIKVKEGFIWRSNSTVSPGDSKHATLFSNTIDSLTISYQDNGVWKQIPGCPRGDYHHVSINAYVVADPVNPKLPRCEREVFPVAITNVNP